VNAALARGYSTFSYDRLGIGESSHGEPVNEIQSMLEIAALKALTIALREGSLPGVKARFDKIVHAGHSYGAIQTYGLTAADPNISDGIVLQGFALTPDFLPFFGYGGNFVEARSNPALAAYPPGYMALGDASAVHNNLFAPGQFDPEILPATTAAGQPVTVGELLTLGAPTSGPNAFGGPVLLVIGGELH
jgi:pimeloyl-ACP methyl ester carboxylesterase